MNLKYSKDMEKAGRFWIQTVEFCCEEMMKQVLTGVIHVSNNLSHYTNEHVSIFIRELGVNAKFCPFCGAEFTKSMKEE